jgi:hypothetical protein
MKIDCSYPLSAAGEERVDQRSVVGVSRRVVQALAVMHSGFTHPVIAALDHPLFRKRERGKSDFSKAQGLKRRYSLATFYLPVSVTEYE